MLAVLSLGIFAFGCGGDDGASQEELDRARAEGAKEAKEQAKVDALQEDINQLKKSNRKAASQNRSAGSSSATPSSTPASSGFQAAKTCTGGVQANANTSCEFAMNVAGEYGSNPGSGSIQAYSPVTGELYPMSCLSSGSGTVCSGGNNASVFIP